MNELEPLKSRWKEVGVQFGFAMNDLDAIQKSNPQGGVEEWMSTMLDRKLRSTPGFGWDDVSEARKRLEEKAQANCLRGKLNMYCMYVSKPLKLRVSNVSKPLMLRSKF